MAVKTKYVKPGTVLIADDGMSCIHPGTRCVVKEDGEGLFVRCSGGRHALDIRSEICGFYMMHMLPCGCASDGSIICEEHTNEEAKNIQMMTEYRQLVERMVQKLYTAGHRFDGLHTACDDCSWIVEAHELIRRG